MSHPTIEETKAFAHKIHAGQVDKAGKPYSGHLDRVAQTVWDWLCPEACIHAAYLHDSVEDGKTTFRVLAEKGYSTEVIEIVELLTKEEDESYGEFIYRIATSGNKGAIRVKIADNLDNSSEKRLMCLPDSKSQELIKKYKAARLVLEGVLHHES